MNTAPVQLPQIGWREYLASPDLDIRMIKAKVDTAARTSALHSSEVEVYESDEGIKRVRFQAHPMHRDPGFSLACDLPLSSYRSVRNSGGKEEIRPFITLPVIIGEHLFETEISLANRKNMKFRMLLGRTALKGRFVVDSGTSYLLSQRPKVLH